MCLTETQHKYLRVNIHNTSDHVHSHRNEKDKKGGGLSILTRKSQDRHMEKINSKNSSILTVKFTIKKYVFFLLY